MTHRWQRPRYARDTAFHACTRSAGSYVTACAGRWPTTDVTDELAEVGVGSGAEATRKCTACVEVVGRG
jgi:hypothetical protein